MRKANLHKPNIGMNNKLQLRLMAEFCINLSVEKESEKVIHYIGNGRDMTLTIYRISMNIRESYNLEFKNKNIGVDIKELMPQAFDSVEMQGSIYLVGGYLSGIYSKHTYRIDIPKPPSPPKTLNPELEGDLHLGRRGLSLVGVGEVNIWAVGGYNRGEEGYKLSSCERYNLKEKEWTLMPSLLVPCSHPCVLLSGGYIYLFGGHRPVLHDHAPQHPLERINILDSHSLWEAIPLTTGIRMDGIIHQLPLPLSTNYLLFAGGYNIQGFKGGFLDATILFSTRNMAFLYPVTTGNLDPDNAQGSTHENTINSLPMKTEFYHSHPLQLGLYIYAIESQEKKVLCYSLLHNKWKEINKDI